MPFGCGITLESQCNVDGERDHVGRWGKAGILFLTPHAYAPQVGFYSLRLLKTSAQLTNHRAKYSSGQLWVRMMTLIDRALSRHRSWHIWNLTPKLIAIRWCATTSGLVVPTSGDAETLQLNIDSCHSNILLIRLPEYCWALWRSVMVKCGGTV